VGMIIYLQIESYSEYIHIRYLLQCYKTQARGIPLALRISLIKLY